MLLDVPESFEWNPYPQVELYYGYGADHKLVSVQIMDSESSLAKFTAGVERRAGMIAAETNYKTKEPMLLENERLEAGTVLLKRHDNREIVWSYVYELHVLYEASHVLIRAESFPSDGDAVLPRLRRVATQIKKQEGDVSQWAAGFCLGPLLIDADNDYEAINVRGYDQDRRRRDIAIGFSSDNFGGGSAETLSERAKMGMEIFGSDLNILRKGEVQLRGRAAEEALAKIKAADGRYELSFGLWSRPQQATIAEPSISLSLRTGGRLPGRSSYDPLSYGPDNSSSTGKGPEQVRSSLSDGEAIGLWEVIIASVRPRPGAVQGSSGQPR